MINSGDWNGMESSVLKKEGSGDDREERALAARLSITSCVTGYSPVSVTGVSRSLSYTARSAAAVPVPEDQLPADACRRWKAISPLAPANLRWLPSTSG